MKSLRNAFVAGGSALVLALSLAACGGGGEQQPAATDAGAEQPASSAAASHDANLKPEDINPGWVEDSDNNPGGTSDLWWPNGDTGASEAIYFTNAANDAGMTVTTVFSDNRPESSVWDAEIVDDHLKTKKGAEGEERTVDITFQDNFTCYDAVTDTTYIRGDKSEADYQLMVAGKVFVQDPEVPEDVMVTFSEGGTVTQAQGSKSVEGTWVVQTPNVVVCHYTSDTSEWDTEYRFVLDSAGEVTELDDGGMKNLVLFA